MNYSASIRPILLLAVSGLGMALARIRLRESSSACRLEMRENVYDRESSKRVHGGSQSKSVKARLFLLAMIYGPSSRYETLYELSSIRPAAPRASAVPQLRCSTGRLQATIVCPGDNKYTRT